jgi:hypothetical protein
MAGSRECLALAAGQDVPAAQEALPDIPLTPVQCYRSFSPAMVVYVRTVLPKVVSGITRFGATERMRSLIYRIQHPSHER